MTGHGDLHGRSVTDDAFYEWLLSDHPAARAERDYRRAGTYQYQRDQAAAVRAWADKINAQADAPLTARDLADSMGPLAEKSALRAEVEFAEPDDLYVTRVRAEFETYMQVSGPLDAYGYRYPEHLTGPSAASYPPPPATQAEEPEIGGLRPQGAFPAGYAGPRPAQPGTGRPLPVYPKFYGCEPGQPVDEWITETRC